MRQQEGNYVSSSAVFPVDIFKANLPVRVHTSIFTAEAVALKLAIQYIQRDAIPKSVIDSDSLSCLQALAKTNFENSIIREIVHNITHLHQVGLHIVFVRYLTIRKLIKLQKTKLITKFMG